MSTFRDQEQKEPFSGNGRAIITKEGGGWQWVSNRIKEHGKF